MDYTKYNKLKELLQLINETVSNDTYNLGDHFFEDIVIKLNKALNADYTFVGTLSNNAAEISTIALVDREGLMENFSYSLKDTPCANVIGQAPCSYDRDITTLFPNDKLLIDMGIEAYVGVPLYDSKSNPTGIIVCLFKQPLENIYAIESVLMIFASRAGAELEHLKLYEDLERHKQELERKVEERTKELKRKNIELEESNRKLKKTQVQLVQSEKMASLGVLTAGVAHEINNPLNYIMGGYTGLLEFLEEKGYLENEKVKILLNSIRSGVKRSSEIVKSLNQFSRHNDTFKDICNIQNILGDCLLMLRSSMKDKVNLNYSCVQEEIMVEGNVGKLYQAFLNVLTNAVQAIPDTGTITISISKSIDMIIVVIKDTGIGISHEIISKIMDPFFTTKDPGEGTGLGLSITYAIIKEHKGNIEIVSEENGGTTVTIYLPFKQNAHT